MKWFFKNKVPKIKKSNLTQFEKLIFDKLIISLPNIYGNKLVKQLSYLKWIRRISYSKSTVTELYTDKDVYIPNELLFLRKEEFHLGNIRFEIEEVRYLARFHMVSGRIFDISVKPIPPKNIDVMKIDVIDIKVDKNLDQNIYG